MHYELVEPILSISADGTVRRLLGRNRPRKFILSGPRTASGGRDFGFRQPPAGMIGNGLEAAHELGGRRVGAGSISSRSQSTLHDDAATVGSARRAASPREQRPSSLFRQHVGKGVRQGERGLRSPERLGLRNLFLRQWCA